MPPIRLAIHGAAGRMGQRLLALAAADKAFRLVAAVEYAGHPRLGQDAGLAAGVGELGLPLVASLVGQPDVAVDFSTPAGAMSAAEACLVHRVPLVLATTGLEPPQVARVEEISRSIAVLRAPSMSLAVNLTMKLARDAATALKDHPGGADVEIVERHHRFKEDAPSGTALKFGEIISQAMGLTAARHGREGRPGARPHGEIGYHAVRTGDNPGEHTVIFGLLGEMIELRVAASNRDCYAHGALAAARFLAGKPPGRYTMSDVLGL